MSETNQTVTIPIKRRVVVQELVGGIYVVTADEGEPAMVTTPSAMHAALNAALHIVPEKRGQKPKLQPAREKKAS